MAEVFRRLFSNRGLTIIAAILAMGILLDGKLYNRTPATRTIFEIPAPSEIIIRQQDNIIMAFEKQTDRWLLTTPEIAPLNSERVQVLLDSNRQTSRRYDTNELPVEELFTNPVSVEIDGHPFQLGMIEPVSKQRYVLANDKVYLQADHVMPMIRSGTSPFIDLAVTKSVTRVSIDGLVSEQITDWSSLVALGILPRRHITTAPVHSIEISNAANHNTRFQLFFQEGVAILAKPDSEFGYLISAQQAQKLGLTVASGIN